MDLPAVSGTARHSVVWRPAINTPNDSDVALLPPLSGSAVFKPSLPETLGYYWVTKKPGDSPVMLYLTTGKNYRHDGRSVEAWECPGIGRHRLDLHNMPRWMWMPIFPPNDQAH